MIDSVAALIVAENTWLPVAMTLAAASAAAVIARHRAAGSTRVVIAAMNLFAGVMLATMGAGHLLAVTTKLLSGTNLVIWWFGDLVILAHLIWGFGIC